LCNFKHRALLQRLDDVAPRCRFLFRHSSGLDYNYIPVKFYSAVRVLTAVLLS
jgi:hypothetical protein